MSDTVERTAYGEVQRLWLANIPPSSYNLWVLAMLQNFIGRVARLSNFSGCRVSCFRLRKFKKLDRLVVMGPLCTYASDDVAVPILARDYS